MTLIPADTKDEKHQQDRYPDSSSRSLPHQTTNQFPNPILSATNPHHQDNQSPFSPPPYSETDSVYTSANPDIPSTNNALPNPSTSTPQATSAPPPQSNAISAVTSVNLSGPLHITGPVKSSSSVTLKHHITIDGKVDAASHVWLEDQVVVRGKVGSSSKITLREGVRVEGKVDGSAAVELLNSIHITDKISASGSISLHQPLNSSLIFIGGKVSSSSAIDIVGGRIEIVGSVKASGAIRIRSELGEMEGKEKGEEKEKCILKLGGKIEGASLSVEGEVEILGDFYSSRTLKLKGNLHVNGDLEIKGDLVMRKGDTVTVSGKRTIHGSIKEV